MPGTPITNTKTAFAVRVFMPDINGKYRRVGSIRRITPTDSGGVTAVGGVGFGNTIDEEVPNLVRHTLEVEYFSLYKQSLFQLLGFGASLRMISEMQVAFDIEQQDVPPDNSAIQSTWYRGCRLTNWSKRQVWESDTIITETASIAYAEADDGTSAVSGDS